VLARIAGLLERARNACAPIFHVQHDGGLGHILAKGSAGWPLRRSRVFGQLPGENKLRPVAGCWFHLSPKSNSSCLVAGCCEACGRGSAQPTVHKFTAPARHCSAVAAVDWPR
jgi:hypothetical protein